MKNIIRNNLWMIIIAWCLYLNGNSVLGLVTCILATLYLIVNTHNRNAWRLITIVLITFILSILLAEATIIGLFKYYTFFTAMISLNVGFMNERLNKERITTLYAIFLVSFITLIIFSLVATVLPSAYVLSGEKTNIFALLILIFIPHTFDILISLLQKEHNRSKILKKIRYKYQQNL